MANSEVEIVDEIEDEAVETELTSLQVSEAVVYATDWTTETVLSQLQRGNIDMNPRFQRRDAWTKPRKSRFIESLILGLPIPQIVLAEKKRGRGKYLVLDGKQRLLTLLQFIGAALGKNNSFRLRGLDVRDDLNGKLYKDLENDPDLQDDLNQFYNQPIRTVVIRNWPNIDFLHVVFVRLNTESVSLSPQEVRQAAFPGDFVDRVDDAACQSTALKILLKTEEPDFRMRDVELLLRYLAFSLFISDYQGNLKKFLDNTCERLNAAWAEKQQEIESQIRNFEKAIDTALDIFGPNRIGRKWTGEDIEPRLNRAVLDVIAFYFSDDKIAEEARKNANDVLESFKALCMESEDFRNSIEKTTKSLGATSTRFSLWGERLREVLGLSFTIPTFQKDRISFPGFWE